MESLKVMTEFILTTILSLSLSVMIIMIMIFIFMWHLYNIIIIGTTKILLLAKNYNTNTHYYNYVIIILCHNLLPFALAGEGGSGARATGMEKKTQQFSMWKLHELSRLKNNKLRPCGIILQLGSLDGHLRWRPRWFVFKLSSRYILTEHMVKC